MYPRLDYSYVKARLDLSTLNTLVLLLAAALYYADYSLFDQERLPE